ncbi:conserved hypothetical protein [delta proteobacterium NaphS2]|nr:conserved hypothetical protein [delta proteobacterium NaphS2]
MLSCWLLIFQGLCQKDSVKKGICCNILILKEKSQYIRKIIGV